MKGISLKIYAHDDQVGPFSRLEIDDEPTIIDERAFFSLTTTWPSADGSGNKTKAIPKIFLVPIYNKVRISLQSVFGITRALDRLVKILNGHIKLFNGEFYWDIYLTTVNKYKSRLLEDKKINGEELKSALSSNYPKYLWVASVEVPSNLLCEFLFDATDIEQGSYLSSIILYDDNFNAVLHSLSEIQTLLSFDQKAQIKCILEYLNKHAQSA